VLHKLAAMPGSQLQLAVWQNCGEKQQRHMCCTIAKHFSMLHVELTTRSVIHQQLLSQEKSWEKILV
jgi:hypothetical protein